MQKNCPCGEGVFQVSWQTLPRSGKVHTPLHQLGCCRRASLRKRQPPKPWQAPEQEVCEGGSSQGHHCMPLSLEGTFTQHHVGKPEGRCCRSRKFLKHCSQHTRSSGKELSLLCRAAWCAPGLSFGVQGQPGRLVAHRQAPLGAALPPTQARAVAGKGQDSGHAVLLKDHGHGRGTTSYSTSCTPEPKKAKKSTPGFAEATGLWMRLPWLVHTSAAEAEAELKPPTVCSLKLCAASRREVGCGKPPDPECPKFKPNVYFTANSCHLRRSNPKLGTEWPAPPLTAQTQSYFFFLPHMPMQYRGCDFNTALLWKQYKIHQLQWISLLDHTFQLVPVHRAVPAWKPRNIKCNNHVLKSEKVVLSLIVLLNFACHCGFMP